MRLAMLNKFVFAVFISLCAAPVFASISDAGLLDNITQRFLLQSATWGTTIQSYASWLFWSLATISMVWTFGMMALRKADLQDFFAEFLRFTITTGFFWWLLSNGPAMAIAIINSLRDVGAIAGRASGVSMPSPITASTPIDIGFSIVKKAFAALSWTNPIDNLAIVLISFAVVLCMAIVAANLLVALVTAWVMAYAGVLILGFGGSRWTSDMAISYFKSMLSIGLELMTMVLLLGISVSVIDGFYANLDGSSVYELLLVFCVCAVLAMLIGKIPGRVASLAGGGSGASFGAGAAIGAAAMGAAAVATGGAALVAGASNAAGGAQALMAAFSKANASESAGGAQNLMAAAGGGGGDLSGSGGRSALASAMGDAHGGGSGSSGGVGSTSSGGALSAASAAAAKGIRVATGTAANLAQGTWDVAKNKASNLKDATMERISETTGGKIATAIKARGTANDQTQSAAFSDNSLSAGSNKSTDADAKAAAFRDRNSPTYF
jgi:P-type conjugative transfer protein TrbL